MTARRIRAALLFCAIALSAAGQTVRWESQKDRGAFLHFAVGLVAKDSFRLEDLEAVVRRVFREHGEQAVVLASIYPEDGFPPPTVMRTDHVNSYQYVQAMQPHRGEWREGRIT